MTTFFIILGLLIAIILIVKTFWKEKMYTINPINGLNFSGCIGINLGDNWELVLSRMAYLLFMMLFAWIGTWPHWLIVVAIVMTCGAFYALFGLAGMTSVIPFKTIAGVILACIDMVYQVYFSIHAVWTSLPYDDGWGMAINILATAVYTALYVGIIFTLVISYKARTE